MTLKAMLQQTKISARDLLDRATSLVATARVSAVGAYVPLCDNEPLAQCVRPCDWDFFMTVAGVFAAATALHQSGVPETLESRMMDIVSHDLYEWNRGALIAFEDCKSLFERTYDGFAKLPSYRADDCFLFADAIGYWLVFNLLKHGPSDRRELIFMRNVGGLVTEQFAAWWD